MDGVGLTTEQRVALAWLYAAAEHAPPPRAFTFRRIGGVVWAQHATAPGRLEYRLPGDALPRFVAAGLITMAEDNHFLLHLDWEGWVHVRHSFTLPAAAIQ